MQLYLPPSIDSTSTLHLLVHIRDGFDCVQQFILPTVTVHHNRSAVEQFVHILQQSKIDLNDDPILHLLNNGDKNIVGQMITSLSQLFNQINNQTIETAIQSKRLFATLV